jgi:mono/diheme cytochrome c family protein
MRSTVLLVVALLAVVLVGLGAPVLQADGDGKAAFLENKCNTCHSVDSQEIAKKSEKMKGPDLSNAGNDAKDAAWLKGFLLKEIEKEDKAHKKAWKGTDEQLDAIVEWLMSLKKTS